MTVRPESHVLPRGGANDHHFGRPRHRLRDPPARRRRQGHIGLAAALALAVGFLGANAFADAAGLPAPRDLEQEPGYVALRVLCGAVVFAVSFVVLAYLFREMRALTGVLARSADRPGPAVALACIVCGTACVVASLVVEVYAARNPATTIGPGLQVAVHTPLMVHIISLLAFVVGVALIAIGIWSSMGRQPTTHGA